MGEKRAIVIALLILCFLVSYFPTINTAKAESSNETWFSNNIIYSYYEAKNGTFEELNSTEFIHYNESEVESYAHSMVLNPTLNNKIENDTVGAMV